MDKREKVIRRIECILNENEMDDGFYLPVLDTVEVLEDALSLLKSQEPIEPIKHLSTGQICGSCKKVLLRRYKYCPACGQAVKWE